MWMLCGCSAPTSGNRPNVVVRISTVEDLALSWHSPTYVDTLRGLRLLRDGPRTDRPTLAITRIVLLTNHRIAPIDALRLAGACVGAAHKQGLLPEFLAATVLQESAFDPRALSAAGAVGIAQFMPETARSYGVNPYDPFDAIRGAASLIGSYQRVYASRYPNSYAAALAAYNAGPGAVSAYHGVPPYPETRQYVTDIYERWARILSQERE
ncbi:MAG: lytic transglycosylase domain-containing protein [Candidatus Eremiobacteraeota bacterium]|nr:lytic transglycosylase domain-containing protein [Candidatus Eremiobacteraeota bacterium]